MFNPRSKLALWLVLLVAFACCGATYGTSGWRYIQLSGTNVNATLIAWANTNNGHPGPGIVLDPNNSNSPGTTTTVGGTSSTIRIRAPWRSIKLGVANTGGNAPFSHQAVHDGIVNLSGAISWFYSYGVTPWATPPTYNTPITDPGPSLGDVPGVQFVPMFLDGSHVNATEIAFAQPYVNSSGHIITFNEPYGEGNMTPAQAISFWPQIMAMGGRIVAPSIGFTSPTAQTWLSTFMGLIASNGYYVDVLNYHATLGLYDCSIDPVASAGTFFTGLDNMHATYPSYPIWVTEYQFFTSCRFQLEQLWDNILTGLEARPWVERSADWPLGSDPTKPGGAGLSMLSLVDSTGALTDTGKLYSSYIRKFFGAPANDVVAPIYALAPREERKRRRTRRPHSRMRRAA